MDIETFRKRFVNHSDEELILMLTKNAGKYNPDALTVAKEILIERNVDIETILKNENEYDEDLSEEEIERRYIENLSPLEQIEYLSNVRVNFEDSIEEIVEENTRDLTDEELLLNFEEILNKASRNILGKIERRAELNVLQRILLNHVLKRVFGYVDIIKEYGLTEEARIIIISP